MFITEKHNLYVINTVIMCMSAYLYGLQNILLLKYWYFFLTTFVLIMRIIDFFELDYQWVLVEFCYVFNFYASHQILKNNINNVFPFLNGSMFLWVIKNGETINQSNLASLVGCALHIFGGLFSSCIYWKNRENIQITYEIFEYQFIESFKIYLLWLIPYCIWLFIFNEKNVMTNLKIAFDKDIKSKVFNIEKIQYLLLHIILNIVGITWGIFSMCYKEFNNLSILIWILHSCYKSRNFIKNNEKSYGNLR